MENLTTLAVLVGAVLVALLVIGTTMARLYKRASKEIAFVRTGLGGQRVVLDGGALVLPVVHDTIPVNMNTLRLEVQRINEQALITHDRMRADVQAEFYVRVQPTQEAIADAAQTLGQRTMQPQDLKELVEGKFVDALRAVAAEMAMEELHEKRVDFVQKVQMAVTEDLLKNGLELESVSLTSLDQTSRDFLNPQNAFDAQGLTLLTQQIEMRRKERNDIEQETEGRGAEQESRGGAAEAGDRQAAGARHPGAAARGGIRAPGADPGNRDTAGLPGGRDRPAEGRAGTRGQGNGDRRATKGGPGADPVGSSRRRRRDQEGAIDS